MKHAPIVPTLFGFLASLGPAFGTDAVTGDEVFFITYNGEVERCVVIAPMPGVVYDEDDAEEEAELCELDLYDPDIALCPKIWSTSPSIVLYDLKDSDFEGDRRKFQEKVCPGGKVAKYVASEELARLKFTMNQETTSAAYVPAPMLYYHFARYLDTEVGVVPAVWRTVDAQALYQEVALGGAKLTAGNEVLTKVHAAWQTIVDVIDDPASYAREGAYGTSADLLTTEGTQVYGVLLDSSGDGYGPEMNSYEPDPWTDVEQRAMFARTPAFIALSTPGSLDDAFAAARAGAIPPLEETMPDGLSDQQLVFWMQEMSEIVLLDDMLGQQDRPGNIDMKEYYYWIEDGEIEREKAKGHEPGDDDVPAEALLIMRSLLNDNDAAGRTEYDNQTELGGMVAELRHLNANTYRRVQSLAAEIRSEGPAWNWLNTSVGLETAQAEMIGANILRIAETLAETCEAGDLSFDLDPFGYFLSGETPAEEVPCTVK